MNRVGAKRGMNILRQPVMRPVIALSLSLWWLSGCGADPKPEPAAVVPNKPVAAAKPVEDPTVRMARAVGDGKPGAAVGIKYDLSSKPEVGVPLEVQVAFLPSVGVDSLEATFSGMEGIALNGTLTAAFTAVKSGEMYRHTFTVLPERNGVFYVTVNASTRFGGTSMARTFAIPFVVGDRAAQAKPAAPQKDVNGRPIQPMKAEEPPR